MKNLNVLLIKHLSTVIIILLSLNIGCTSINEYNSGEKFDFEKAKQIKRGMTSEQVLQIMETSPIHNDTSGIHMTWTWVQTTADTRKVGTVFSVSFEKDAVTGTSLHGPGYSKSEHKTYKSNYDYLK